MLADKLREAFGRFNAGDAPGTERLCNEVLKEAPGNADALHLLGVLRLMNGNLADAVLLLGKACEAKPGDTAILGNLGLAYLAARNHAQAEAVLRKALGLGESHGLLYMRLGLALGAQGKVAEALSMLQTAAGKLPGDPDVQLNLGNALVQAGRFDEAQGCYQKVLALQPRHVDAYFNLGTLFKQTGRLDEAVASYQRALEFAPDYADAHTSLGAAYAEQGRTEDAIASLRRALELAPGQVQAHNNMGNVYLGQGRREEAIACYEHALAIAPDHPDAYVNLGNVRAEQGNYAVAQELYEKAGLLAPRSVDVQRNLGRLARVLGRRAAALAYYRRALELAPNEADSYSDMGSAHRDLGDLNEAEGWYRKAIAMSPEHVHSLYELAEILKVQSRFDEAVALYERVLGLQADYFAALGGLIYVRQHMCAWEGIEVLWERLRREAIGRPGSGITPFSILSQPTSPAEQLACAHAWAEQELKPLENHAAALGFDFAQRKPKLPLRIGYLSWDFHAHATSYLIAELFELHDRTRCEIHTYSYGPDDGSAIRARIRSASDRFTDLAERSPTEIAQAIYGDNIDILVDLKGYTQGARTQVLALRPAPVQVNWLGFPGTMGADFIDYVIADPFVIPAGAERHYSEKVVRLPDCYQINDRRRAISAQVPSRQACGLPPQGIVFCCFNHNNKIIPEVFARWMRILKAVPDSALWLLETNPWAVENLRRHAAGQGVAPERLVFAPRLTMSEHLARYRVADLALDTFPYTSHTTASDALWAGCPLVTCAGETFASRVAGSLLINAGMPQLVTDSFDAYELLVRELAASPAKLHDLRRQLENRRDTCPLFDTPRFVRNLERAYAEMSLAHTGKR